MTLYVDEGFRRVAVVRASPLPLVLGLSAVFASGFVTQAIARKGVPMPAFAWQDWLALAVGFAGMWLANALSVTPASVWSPFIDLGSFAVGASLMAVSKPGSWARTVGGLQVGIHVAQAVGYWRSDE